MIRIGQLQGFYRTNEIGAASLTLVDSGSSTVSTSTYSFSSKALGVADASRFIICAFGVNRAASGLTLNTVTIAGVTATIAVNATHDTGALTGISALAISAVPSGTTGTIAINLNLSSSQCAFALYRAIMSTATVSDNATDTAAQLSGLCDIPVNGFIIASAFSFNTSGTAFQWSGGVLEDVDMSTQANTAFSTASKKTLYPVTNLPVIADSNGSPADAALAVASWGL